MPPMSRTAIGAAHVKVDCPMTAGDHVKAIHIFNEKNPQPQFFSAAVACPGRAQLATRVRLADTQNLIAIAEMSDGTCWSDDVDVIVTIAACLETSPDGPRSHQRSGQREEGRDHRDQDADLARHGNRLPHRQRRQASSRATSSTLFVLHLQRRRKFSAPRCFRRSPPIPSSRSPWWRPKAAPSPSAGAATTAFAATSIGRDHRRMSAPFASRAIRLLAILCGCASALAAEIPLPDRSPATSQMGAGRKAMQDDDTANPAMLWVLDGEALWNAQGGRRRQGLRRLPRRCRDEHERRRRALSRLRRRERPADRSRAAASISAAPSSSRRRRSPFESKELLALTAYVARQSRGMPIAPADDARLGRPSRRARHLRRAPGPAQSRLRAMPRRQLGQQARRRADPAGASDRLPDLSAGMAERSARCSAGCATA